MNKSLPNCQNICYTLPNYNFLHKGGKSMKRNTEIKKTVRQHQGWVELALIWAGGAVAISGFVLGEVLPVSSDLFKPF